MTQNHRGSGRAYAELCGDLVAYDCAVQLLDQKDAGQSLPSMPDGLRAAIEADQGSVAIAILADLQQTIHTETPANTTYANTQSRPPQPEDLSFPVPLLILGAVGLAAVGIKAAAERFYSPNEDDLDRELEAWEKQLESFAPIADLPAAQTEIVSPSLSVSPSHSSPGFSPSSPKSIHPIELESAPARFDWDALSNVDAYPHLLILGLSE